MPTPDTDHGGVSRPTDLVLPGPDASYASCVFSCSLSQICHDADTSQGLYCTFSTSCGSCGHLSYFSTSSISCVYPYPNNIYVLPWREGAHSSLLVSRQVGIHVLTCIVFMSYSLLLVSRQIATLTLSLCIKPRFHENPCQRPSLRTR